MPHSGILSIALSNVRWGLEDIGGKAIEYLCVNGFISRKIYIIGGKQIPNSVMSKAVYQGYNGNGER